jgi:hypothetical protein
MNINIKHILALVFAIVISIMLLFMATGCHNAKFHLDKFYKKGGVITCDTIYVSKTDTLVVKGKDGKDSLVYITTQVPCNCPEATVETKWQTRWQTRFDNKRFKDSLKIMARMYDDSLDAAVRINKQDNKADAKKTKYKERSGFPWWMLFLSIILVVGLLIIKQFRK